MIGRVRDMSLNVSLCKVTSFFANEKKTNGVICNSQLFLKLALAHVMTYLYSISNPFYKIANASGN